MEKLRSIGVNFFATTDEFLCFIREVSNEYNMGISVIRSNPIRVQPLAHEDIDEVKQLIKKEIITIFLKKGTITYGNIKYSSDFYDMNPGGITFTFIKANDPDANYSLHEILFSYYRSFVDYEIAKKISNRLKKITKNHVVMVFDSGANLGLELRVRDIRYTPGAKKLYDLGVKMIPLQPCCYLKLIE